MWISSLYYLLHFPSAHFSLLKQDETLTAKYPTIIHRKISIITGLTAASNSVVESNGLTSNPIDIEPRAIPASNAPTSMNKPIAISAPPTIMSAGIM